MPRLARAALLALLACGRAAATGAPRTAPRGAASSNAARFFAPAAAAQRAAQPSPPSPSVLPNVSAFAAAPGPTEDPLAGAAQRIDSGPLAGTAATCSASVGSVLGDLLGGCGSLASGGALNRVAVYNTAGGTRVFYLALPRGADAPGAQPRPLLLGLHGGASYGNLFLSWTGLDAKGVAQGYVVAAPDGLPGSLGAGGTWGIHNAPGDGSGDVRPEVDDLAFMGDILKCIAALGVPLSGDVAVAGYSLGAKFACRVACAPPAGARVRALALAGGIQGELSRPCGGAPVPLLLFQGAADPQVPFCDRAAHMGPMAYAPGRDSFAAWVRYNSGGARPAATTCSVFGATVAYGHGAGGGGGVATTLVWLPGGGHVWPTAPLEGCAGDGADVALAFFATSAAGAGADAPPPLPLAICGGMAPCTRGPPCGGSWLGDDLSLLSARR